MGVRSTAESGAGSPVLLSLLTMCGMAGAAASIAQLHPDLQTVAETQGQPHSPLSAREGPGTHTPGTHTPGTHQVRFLPLIVGTNEHKVLGKDMVRMPGTKWCGIGWRTDKAEKFGGYASTDRCCRQHDLGCPDFIKPGEIKYGLLNDRYHTVMHCSCDDRFRSCLKLVHSQAADIVGNLFFNVGNTHCFVFRVERVCTRTNWWGRCLQEEERPMAAWRKPVAYTS